MYVSVLNLPRNERYATNNVILLGIIPGPNEPKKTMNSYLQPLVNDLLTLWKGVVMISAFGTPVIVRAALICTSCDIPASRKVSGFVGHSAYRACSKCLKAFPTEHFGEKPDYSGTERNSWTPRCMDSHYEHAMQYKNACTQEQRKDIEHKFGCRYSALIELPYYDVIRFCVIDPMHNLLLGTAKHMIKVWTEIGILDKTHFTRMQDKVNCFITPEIGRIPSKIASGFASLTAEQWRNWILVYSLCCLKDILPHHHYDCWLLFVKAISILCQRKVTVSDLHKGDKLLMEFSETFQSLYGKKYYTINMHLHAHLMDCILDFGPVYSFWLFSFERLNGVLGSYHTNGHDISLQIMRKFTSSTYHCIQNWPEEYRNHLYPFLKKHQYCQGSLETASVQQVLEDFQFEDVKPLPPVHEMAWELHQKDPLHELLLSGIGHCNFDILTLFDKATAISVGEFVLGSTKSRFFTKSHVMALHPNNPDQCFLAMIEYFAKVNVRDNQCSNESISTVWVACVTFYMEHPCKSWFGGPMQVWSKSTSFDCHFINLSSIKSRVAYCETDVDFGGMVGQQNVLIVSVLSNFGN